MRNKLIGIRLTRLLDSPVSPETSFATIYRGIYSTPLIESELPVTRSSGEFSEQTFNTIMSLPSEAIESVC